MKEFFLKKVKFVSEDSDWHKRYLASSNDRITFILRHDLGNLFWQKYSDVLVRFHTEHRLLFRSKYIDQTGVCLDQIWNSKADYDDFMLQAMPDTNLVELLKKYQINVHQEQTQIQSDHVENYIANILSKPHIIQFKSKLLPVQLPMQAGDPLKTGRNYLPFPDQK